MADRIEQLAQPKPNLLKYPDRRSVYWLDELPVKASSSTTTFDLTPRWSQLAQKIRLNSHFQASRLSPTWPVSAAALKACPSERVCSLALPLPPTSGWQPDRPLQSAVSAAVRTAVPSPRICQLAQPRRLVTPLSQNESRSTLTDFKLTTPSSRIQRLAIPKPEHPQHHLGRPVSWPVRESARHVTPSERVLELAKPKSRTPLFEGYDPYCVSEAARCARASPRVLELCVPFPRKCRGK